MNCNQYSEWISAYIDGELEDKDRTILEKHIESCHSCREEVQILSEITNNIKALQMSELPDGFHNDLMQRIRLENEQAQGKVIPFPMNKRKWFVRFKIASAVAAAFIFSTVLIKPLVMEQSKGAVPEMAMMEESWEIEDNQAVEDQQLIEDSIVGARRVIEPEDRPVDLPSDVQIDSAPELAKASVAEAAEESPTDSVVSSTAEADVPENQGLGIQGIMVKSQDILPVQICTVMTETPNKEKDYIIGAAKELGIEATITEIVGSMELQNQLITIEMIINSEQGNKLDDKMKDLEKFYEGPDYNQTEGYPEILKLIIRVTEHHSESSR